MRQSYRTLLDLAGPRRLIGHALLTAIAALTEGIGVVLLVPLIASLAGDTAFAGIKLGLPRMPLPLLLAVFVAMVALRGLLEVVRSLSAQRIEAAVVDGLRYQAVAALLGAEWRTLSTMQQSANRALLISSVDRVGEAVHHFSTITRTAVGLAVLAAAGVFLSPPFALGCALFGILALAALRWLRRDARALGEALSRRYEAIYLHLEQTLSALRLIKSFGREKAETEALVRDFTSLRRAERSYILGSALARAALQVSAALVLAAVVWLAVVRWGAAIPVLLAFVALAVRVVPLIEALQTAAQGWIHASPAFEDAARLITNAETAAEEPAHEEAPRLRSALMLDRVSYAHDPERQGVAGVTFTIAAGSITALVGPSGSGKSTLADLVGGLLSPDEGHVTLDDVELTAGLRNAWRRRVAYVQQEPVLFSGSVRDNLLWAEPQAEEPQLRRALASASADFVHALPNGLDCPLGESGRTLSGGERQRIALARALMREPDLLILDEATSAVDADSEQAIVASVRNLAGRCTILVIGHRGALVDCADRTIELDRGRIVAS